MAKNYIIDSVNGQVTAVGGVLHTKAGPLCVTAADAVAKRAGFMYARRLVEHLSQRAGVPVRELTLAADALDATGRNPAAVRVVREFIARIEKNR